MNNRDYYGNQYFWRTTNQSEIDYVEETNGQLTAYEFKWNPKKSRSRFPKSFVQTYDPVHTQTIHRENFWEWLD